MELICIENRRAPFVLAFESSAKEFGYEPKILTPAREPPASFQKFTAVYKHLSVNTENFELACFRRYFEIHKNQPENDRFIIADSDLIITAKKNQIPIALLDSGDSLIASIGVKNNMPEQDASPHFSFWNKKLLCQFIDFLIHTYEFNLESLQSEFNHRKNCGNSRASISDMTLLHMFIKECGIKFINSNTIIEQKYIDHNISMQEAGSSKFNMLFGFKRLKRLDGKIILTKSNGEQITPLALHLQGRAKIVAKDILSGNDISIATKFAAISIAKYARKIILPPL